VDENGEEKMSSGLRAGLVSGQKLREEAAQVRAERKAKLEAMPDSETGKNADTVYRSKTGQKIGREEWVEQQQKKRKKKMSEYPEQELAWGGGLKQQSNKEQQMAEDSRVAAQPFARFEPDAGALDGMHEKQAWHDPMSKYEADEDDLGEGKSASAAAAVSTQVAKKPKCPHPPWPNRFGILPGYRWDGAVRGNGYEKRWLQNKNDRAFNKQEQYKWERLED
jgi:pre-mRNA-splicing factor CWC26